MKIIPKHDKIEGVFGVSSKTEPIRILDNGKEVAVFKRCFKGSCKFYPLPCILEVDKEYEILPDGDYRIVYRG